MGIGFVGTLDAWLGVRPRSEALTLGNLGEGREW